MIKSRWDGTWGVMVPYGLKSGRATLVECATWCETNIDHRWTFERFNNSSNFVFDNKDDSIIFMLRWS